MTCKGTVAITVDNTIRVCGGEMEKVGDIEAPRYGVLEMETLYQCKNCKTISLQ